jgi:hypothetical protein
MVDLLPSQQLSFPFDFLPAFPFLSEISTFSIFVSTLSILTSKFKRNIFKNISKIDPFKPLSLSDIVTLCSLCAYAMVDTADAANFDL